MSKTKNDNDNPSAAAAEKADGTTRNTPQTTGPGDHPPANDLADLLQQCLIRLRPGMAKIRDAWATGDLPAWSQVVMPPLDRLSGIMAGLVAMIMVDHYHGPAGLGLFAWFFSLFSIAGYIAQCGIPLAVENGMGRQADRADDPVAPAPALVALVLLGVVAILVCVLAAVGAPGPGQSATHTVFYLVLGPLILLRNVNALRLAMLDGSGRHHVAARLRLRQRIVFIVVLFLLCKIRLPLPLVTIAFLGGQIALLVMGRKATRLPLMAAIRLGKSRFSQTVAWGRRFLFADNLLDVVFYLDMLVLGWFVGPVELGTYARALVLVRLFLVIPTGWRPVFRRLANRHTETGDRLRLRQLSGWTLRLLFMVHGLAALFGLLHFPALMQLVFESYRSADRVFSLFAIILPGLIFFSATTALEPIYDAHRDTARLKRIVATVALANLVLNINLIPFAGAGGAAMATALAMFIHFLLVSRWLPEDLSGVKMGWPGAAAALYLTYVFLAGRPAVLAFSPVLVPSLLGAMLWITGFFDLGHPTGGPGHTASGRLLPERRSL